MIFFLMSCQKDTKALLNSEQDKNVFSYNDFFKQTPSKIAQELSEILGISINSIFTEVTPQDWPVGLASHPWVEKGYKFETNNGASIVTWVDQNENNIYVTYLLRRWSVSDSNSYGLDKVDSAFKRLLPQIGIELDGTEIYSCFESQVTDFHPPKKIYYYYKVNLYQTYNEKRIENPYLEADIEGSTGEINYLKFGKWYYNIN